MEQKAEEGLRIFCRKENSNSVLTSKPQNSVWRRLKKKLRKAADLNVGKDTKGKFCSAMF